MVHFQVAYKSSDLDIGIPRDRYLPTFVGRAQAIVRAYHRQLQAYIDEHPAFGFSLVPPVPLGPKPPPSPKIWQQRLSWPVLAPWPP
jgi:hypothetical protein